MTHSRSAEKRVRQAERRRERNKAVRSSTRTQIRKALPLVAEGHLEEAEGAVREAASALDRAAGKGIIHPNNAARHKSRLMLHLNAAAAKAAARLRQQRRRRPSRSAQRARRRNR